MNQTKQQFKNIVNALQDNWVSVLLIISGILLMEFMPDYQFIAFGLIKLSSVLLSVFIIRSVSDCSIHEYIRKGGYSLDFESLNPVAKVAVTVFNKAILFIVAALCFIF